jgi:hypothetical protein
VSPLLLGLCLVPGLLVACQFWRHFPADLFGPNHQLVVRDYLNMWAGGTLARAGRFDILFDPLANANWLWSTFGSQLDLHHWAYPPPMLLFAVPFSHLGLVPGFFVWAAFTSGLLWCVLRAAGLPAAYAFAVVFSPAGLENLLVGQNGALTAAALAGGLLFAQRRSILAGALLGLLVLKPQLGLLVPVYLLARRDWRTLFWAAVFGLGWCAASVAAFGWDVWRAYATVTAPFMRGYIDAPFGLAAHYMMVPPFITLRAAGASLPVAYAGQALASLVCAALAYWVGSRRLGDRQAAVAVVLCLAPLATPYSHAYDLVCVAVGCALLARVARCGGYLGTAERLTLGPAWLWPGGAFPIGLMICPGLGVVAVGLAAWLGLRLVGRPDGLWHAVYTDMSRFVRIGIKKGRTTRFVD